MTRILLNAYGGIVSPSYDDQGAHHGREAVLRELYAVFGVRYSGDPTKLLDMNPNEVETMEEKITVLSGVVDILHPDYKFKLMLYDHEFIIENIKYPITQYAAMWVEFDTHSHNTINLVLRDGKTSRQEFDLCDPNCFTKLKLAVKGGEDELKRSQDIFVSRRYK